MVGVMLVVVLIGCGWCCCCWWCGSDVGGNVGGVGLVLVLLL